MSYILTVGHHSAVQRKDILTQATTWMNLEDTMLSEVSQSHKGKCCVIPLMRYAEYSRSEAESRILVVGTGERDGGVVI